VIAIIDYDMGNLRSVQKAFEAVGHRAMVTRNPRVIADASHVVLPGVGAFGDCMRNLEAYGLIDPIKQAIAAGKPFLGICLGLQLLFTESEEFGRHKGLDIIPGRVVRFAWEGARLGAPGVGGCNWEGARLTGAEPVSAGSGREGGIAPGAGEIGGCDRQPRLKVPHMGWNAIVPKRKSPVLEAVPEGASMYFVHSYYVVPDDPGVVCTATEYGAPFVSSITRENIFACQFHPEKSQAAGLRILQNFGALS
jgi:imidazole glycerol-phosphate synthase subunit HisH